MPSPEKLSHSGDRVITLVRSGWSDKDYQRLGSLAKSLGVSRSELVRHSLEILTILHKEINSGAEILIHYPKKDKTWLVRGI